MTSAEFRNARLQLGLSQEEVARRFDVSVYTVSLWERKKPSKHGVLAMEKLQRAANRRRI